MAFEKFNGGINSMSKAASLRDSPRESLLVKTFHHFFEPIRSRLKHRWGVRKFADRADARRFDWNWKQINFNRIALVNILLSGKADPAYLEIGCASNALFDSVPVLNKIGVDPASGGTIRATSDEFFAANSAKFDVIFIDGLHTYEQVRKDVINAMKSLQPGGWIALHDMLPRNWIENNVPMVSLEAWTGDVWKVGFELAQTEGIEFNIVKIDHGVGVVRITDRNAVLKDLTRELRDRAFSYYYDNIDRLPIMEWDAAQSWLRR